MLFQLIVRESDISLYSIRKLHISLYVSSIFLIFALTEKGSYKIRQMKSRTFEMEGIFFSTNVSHKCFLREACGKQISGERRLLGTYGT